MTQTSACRYDEAVAKCKEIVAAAIKPYEMQIGEIAHRLEQKYDEETPARFAKDNGLRVATLGGSTTGANIGWIRALPGREAAERNEILRTFYAHRFAPRGFDRTRRLAQTAGAARLDAVMGPAPSER
jgi:hypothetical protein